MDENEKPWAIRTRGEYSIDRWGNLFHHHALAECSGRCCFHNPSDHHMVKWELNWRGDLGIMERLCPHGIGHPDPDDTNVRENKFLGVHGCDGCCSCLNGIQLGRTGNDSGNRGDT